MDEGIAFQTGSPDSCNALDSFAFNSDGMREIKFRAWDTSDAEHPHMLGPYDFTDSIFNYKGVRELPLMQFTGLHDKNGKEIYEGDIVRLIEPNRLYTVQWDEFGFKLFHADPNLNKLQWGGLNRVAEFKWTMEVIGNIYEPY